jgi:tricorn protease
MRISHLRRAALLVFLALSATPARAQEPIRFARTPDISPDGKLVAFSYLGDVWTVPASGGVARPITMHEKHDMRPVFSPDGRHIAFSSNRHGSYDVFVVPVRGGKPTRLTFDSADDHVCGWSPDGKYVLFSSSRSTSYPFALDLYQVPAKGGREQRITTSGGREGAFSPTGREIAYVRGAGDWYRKGYRGSANDDVWVCNAAGTNNRRLTAFNGKDDSPQWSADGRSLFYVSERFGTANIVRREVGGKAPPKQLTFHKEDGVSSARLSRNGEWFVYECGADLWVVSSKGGAPRKLVIEAYADERSSAESTKTFTKGASEFAVSYDEKQIAFAVHGNLFLMPRGGGKAKRLTDRPCHDHGIAWSADGKKILFLSDRGGHKDIWLLESDDSENAVLDKARKYRVKQLTDTPEAELGVQFSPDGKRISFIQAGKLMTMAPDGKDVKTIANDGKVIDYEWSPDSKWICYAREDGSFASELFIVPANGATPADPPRNVTRYATYNGGITWSHTGNKLAFISDRGNAGTSMYSIHVLSLHKPSGPGAPAPTGAFDWEGIHLRVRQPTSRPVTEGAISPDGNKVAFRSSHDGADLWVASSDGSSVTRLTTGNLRPTRITWSRVLASLIYFTDGEGQLRMVTVGGSGGVVTVPFQAKMTIRLDEELAVMFEQCWRGLFEQFYDPSFHGANWKAVRQKYRPLLKHVAMKEDFYHLIHLMQGELNASHLNIYGNLGPPAEQTADLGLLLDEAYRGPGLRITEILKGGPADRHGLNIKAGDVVLAIDGTEIGDSTNLSKLLNGKVGEGVVLEVTGNPADAKAKKRRVEVQATSRPAVAGLMYDRWVARNAARVSELSKGKFGYIHVPSMDLHGVARFRRALYSDNFDKEAIVLDVRFNGGGYTHEDLLQYLGGKEHTVFRQRTGGHGLVLNYRDRKWHKPVVLLINNRSASDAEIFPHAFRTLGLGKLVGQATGGKVIGTNNIRLIDGSVFRLPRIGVFTVEGVNMEKEGVAPDVLVENHPDHLARGIDAQLVKAVEVLQQDVLAWKKRRSPGVVRPSGAGPSGATPATKKGGPS